MLRFENQVVFNNPEGLLVQIKQYFSWNQQPPRRFAAPLLEKEGSFFILPFEEWEKNLRL